MFNENLKLFREEHEPIGRASVIPNENSNEKAEFGYISMMA